MITGTALVVIIHMIDSLNVSSVRYQIKLWLRYHIRNNVGLLLVSNYSLKPTLRKVRYDFLCLWPNVRHFIVWKYSIITRNQNLFIPMNLHTICIQLL